MSSRRWIIQKWLEQEQDAWVFFTLSKRVRIFYGKTELTPYLIAVDSASKNRFKYQRRSVPTSCLIYPCSSLRVFLSALDFTCMTLFSLETISYRWLRSTWTQIVIKWSQASASSISGRKMTSSRHTRSFRSSITRSSALRNRTWIAICSQSRFISFCETRSTVPQFTKRAPISHSWNLRKKSSLWLLWLVRIINWLPDMQRS